MILREPLVKVDSGVCFNANHPRITKTHKAQKWMLMRFHSITNKLKMDFVSCTISQGIIVQILRYIIRYNSRNKYQASVVVARCWIVLSVLYPGSGESCTLKQSEKSVTRSKSECCAARQQDAFWCNVNECWLNATFVVYQFIFKWYCCSNCSERQSKFKRSPRKANTHSIC